MAVLAESPVLQLGVPVEHTLAPHESHTYLLNLDAGEYIHLVAEQQGVDVSLKLADPTGTEIVRVDSPTGTLGVEPLWEIVKSPGTYRLEVRHEEGGGEETAYRLRWIERRPPREDDRTRVLGARAFLRGEEQRRRGEPAKALPHYEQALEHWTSTGDRHPVARVHLRLGLMHQRLGEPDRALEHYRAARNGFEELGQDHELASVLLLLSVPQADEHRLSDSLDHARRAADIFREMGDLPAEADARYRLGQLSRKLYRLEESMDAYERALELWDSLDDKGRAALAHFEMARLYVFRSDSLATRHHFERARDLAERAGNSELGRRIERHLADVTGERDFRPGLLEDLTEDLATLRREGGSPEEVLWLLQCLGSRLREAGELDAARTYLEEGLEMSRAHDLALWEGEMVHGLGRIAHAEGRHVAARDLQAEAASLHAKTGNAQGFVSARFAEARALYHLSEYPKARQILEELVTGAEDLRVATESHALRASYLAARRHYWELYVQTLMRLHDQDPQAGFDVLALQASERARSRSLLDLLQEASFRVRDSGDMELLEAQQGILKHLARLEVGAGSMPPDELTRQRIRLQLELKELDRRLRKSHPRYEEILSAEPLPLGEVLDTLPTGIQVLVYFLAEERSFVWNIEVDGTVSSATLPGRAVLEASVRDLLNNLPGLQSQDQERRPVLAQEVSDALLGPVADQLSSEHLVIVPDGVLHVLPFAALPLPGQEPDAEGDLWIDRFTVSTGPSLSTLSFLGQRDRSRKQTMDRVAIFADPVFTARDERVSTKTPSSDIDVSGVPEPVLRSAQRLGLGEFPRLTDSGREARDLAETARNEGLVVNLYLGYEANRSNLRSAQSGQYRVLHFATHAIPNESQPEFSSLLLSLVNQQGQAQDGYIRLQELYGLDLPSDLVVLSACETGLGQELLGEGIVGLTRGFYYAGASQVLHSLWSVDDAGTAELMTRFYRQLLHEGKPAAEALRLAQLSMRREARWRAPLYWAGFTLQGAPRLSDELDDLPIEKTLTPEPEPTPDPDPGDLPGGGGQDS